jgi:hypothetical protein
VRPCQEHRDEYVGHELQKEKSHHSADAVFGEVLQEVEQAWQDAQGNDAGPFQSLRDEWLS